MNMSHLDTCIKNVIARICAECDEAKIDGEYSKGNVWYCSECWFVWDETQKNDNNNNTNTNTGNVTQNMNTNTGNVAPSATFGGVRLPYPLQLPLVASQMALPAAQLALPPLNLPQFDVTGAPAQDVMDSGYKLSRQKVFGSKHK
eukprot:520698_1